MVDFKLFWFLLALCVCDGFCEKDDYLRLEPKNPDDTSFRRPCGAVYDVDCVRQYFFEHALCKKTYGPAPDPLRRLETNVNVPRVNLTITIINLAIGGINGQIDEFYVNKDTGKVVIAVEFVNLTQSSNDVYFRFNRRAKEPVVTRAAANITYTSVLITAVIPKIDDLQLDKAEYVAYVNDTNPTLFIGPSAAQSSDPDTATAYADFMADIATNIQEIFLTDAAFYVATFIQYNICDFGLKVL